MLAVDEPSPVRAWAVYEGKVRAGKVVWNRRRRIPEVCHEEEVRIIARILAPCLKIHF
jgi:hypothetical protein